MNNKNDLNIQDKKRLLWACRRGMLELDVLLTKFLNERFESLSDHDKALFIDLLKTEDNLLFAWLMGHEAPTNQDMLKIIGLIRSNVVSSR